MIKYHCTTRFVDDRLFSQAEGDITEVVQPHLDDAVAKGWMPHSFTTNEAENGVNLVFIWQRELFEPEQI